MPILFVHLCSLLSNLESLSRRDPPLLPAHRHQRYRDCIHQWFTSSQISINSSDIDLVALLSAFFPERRTDRVYAIKHQRLSKLLKRCLCLGKERLAMLDQWQKPGRGNLGDCVERALRQAEFPIQPGNQLTVEQVDKALMTVAGKCRFSGPKVKGRKDIFHEVEEDREIQKTLGQIYKRMQSREAKWFTRMILKDYSCLDLSAGMVYYQLDVRLPTAMQMYDDFEAAICELRSLPASQTMCLYQGGLNQHCANDAHLLQPRIGVKLGPPKWVKAKGGVKHAVSIIDERTMSVERKHDGEYCQIHIDMSKGKDCVQIFSKSGKDSTSDRKHVHQAIKDSLRIGHRDCGFSERCILEGELLVWSDKAKGILEFHKLRKHLPRSGSFLGTELDSQPHPWEHLMIMYYDVMLVDNNPVVHRPHKARRQLLERLIKTITGRADIVWQKHIRFDRPTGSEKLKKALAVAFVHRWEGLVLKPSDEPYFTLGKPVERRFPSCWVKLKKDCMKGLGDTADFAIVGAGYDATEAEKYDGMNIRWTHFYIGCLRNKDAVLRASEKPHFLVFDQIKDCIRREDMKTLTEKGCLRAMSTEFPETWEVFNIELAVGLPSMSVIFRKPFVFDVAGSGFDKSPNRDIFTLRFPRLMKVRFDKDWRECVDLKELQDMAIEARTIPKGNLIDEIASWIDKLSNIDRGAGGQASSWDSEDDEQVDHHFLTLNSKAAAPRVTRRPQNAAAPPMIRMDTGEMRDHEQRLCNGAVVKRPNPKHCIGSIISDGTLQTPPPSSSLFKSSGMTSSDKSITRVRKRSAECDDMEDSLRNAKKARLQPCQYSDGEHKPNSTARPGTIKKPLQEIPNLSSPLSVQSTDTLQEKSRSKTGFSLVRKTMDITYPRFHRRNKKSGKYVDLSSPARETTASESTSVNTTQQSVREELLLARHLPPEKIVTKPASFLRSQSMQIPSIKDCDVMLSPCLLDPKHKVNELLCNRSKEALPFPTNIPAKSPDPLFKSIPRYELVVLVESNDTYATGRYVGATLHHILAWYPKAVALWDWRLLQHEWRQDTGEQQKKGLIDNYFVAKLWWDPLIEGQGAVVVGWCAGKPAVVLKSELDVMGWVDVV